jgi:hypothetical protein
VRPIGFSTGAIARGDVRRALEILAPFKLPAVELSALRAHELPELVEIVDTLELGSYETISVHAPSRLEQADEERVVELLHRFVERGWPVIVHPDVMFSLDRWKLLGNKLLLENSDKRKPIGRTARDITALLDYFPSARLCLDLGHARQIDPTMNEAYLMLQQNQDRLGQIHLSDVNYFSRHDPLSGAAIEASRRVAHLVPMKVPIILEMLIDQGQSTIEREISRALEVLQPALQIAV